MDNKETQMRVEIKPEVACGSYSNLAIITHSRSEFILDFAATMPGLATAQVSNRIVMTPEHAKKFLSAIMDNIAKYESQFGPIVVDGAPKGTFNLADFAPQGGTKS